MCDNASDVNVPVPPLVTFALNLKLGIANVPVLLTTVTSASPYAVELAQFAVGFKPVNVVVSGSMCIVILPCSMETLTAVL